MQKTLLETAFETIRLELPSPHVLLLILNRPDRRNAFNTQMARELIAVWDALTVPVQNDIRCVVLTGAGDRAFCSGADLKERNGMTRSDWQAQHALFEQMSYRLMECPVPVIAAVEGAAFAGGFEMMLACTFVYASQNARFALTEVTLGLIPGIGGTQLLPRRVGAARAKEIILTGSPFAAQEAADWGLVNRLCPPGTACAEALKSAEKIAANAPLSVRQALTAIREGADCPIREALAIELACYEPLIDTEDRREGIAAFNEKRKPVFKGR